MGRGMARLSRNKESFRLLGANAKRLWRAVDKCFLLIPPLFTVGLSALIYTNIYFPPKQILESTAILVLSLFTICLACRFWLVRHPFFLWGTVLCGILLMREIHFATTSEMVYVALIVLLYFTLKRLDTLQPYLLQSRIASWITTGFFVYFISMTVDQRWWRGLPWEEVVHVPLEESLEMAGHIIIGVTLLLAKPGSNRRHMRENAQSDEVRLAG
jgi:magnesium-transporting ATPase (P-type)